MFNYLTGNDIFNAVRMKRGAAPDKLFLLVEGDSEYDLLSAHVEEWISLENCHGCENLDDAIDLATSRGETYVAALRDRDWFGVLYAPPAHPNLFLTDYYDLDSTILILTDAGRRVATVFSSAQDRAQWEATHGLSPVQAVISVAAPVGYARLASERWGLGLKTDGTPLAPPVTDSDGHIVVGELASMIRSRTSNCALSTQQIEQAIVNEQDQGAASAERACCGHDLGRALFELIRRQWNGGASGSKFLLEAVRSAMSSAELATLSFAPRIDAWAVTEGKTSAWRP